MKNKNKKKLNKYKRRITILRLILIITKMQKAADQLCNIFQDASFAWELLNAEIVLEMSNIVQGQTIAFLLQLYMRGVQKMNSLADSRQSYFKNKVTSLMTKPTVIKSLKQNPMKKKNRHGQVGAKQQKKQKQKTPLKKKTTKQQINQLQLQQKRRQLQMRMAYVASQHGPDSLKKIIAQQDHRQQNISSKISKIISSHQDRLNQRIKARKLKTSTFRTRSQINIQQAKMTPPQKQDQFSPFKQLLLFAHNKKQQDAGQTGKKMIYTAKRYKSLEIGIGDSPDKRNRKYTFQQQVNPKKSFS